MKRAKKGLAALLSICMLVTFLPASALALGPEVGAEGLDEEAVAPEAGTGRDGYGAGGCRL